MTPSAENDLSNFNAMVERDRDFLSDFHWGTSWAHWQKRLSQGALKHMAFDRFLGADHLRLFCTWIDTIPYPDYFDAKAINTLIDFSHTNDARIFSQLGLHTEDSNLQAIARYNAQDFLFQRAYPVPKHQQVKTLLDFGAGHGRQANLAFHPDSHVQHMITMDAIPASYLTQRLYYKELGIGYTDYMDNADTLNFDTPSQPITHLPSWRGDLVPDNSVDMACAVQVLRELSKPMLKRTLDMFRRVIKPGGALYIRDHIGFHNVNNIDLDGLLKGYGFCLEWHPHITDRVDSHGVPRIWRKADPAVLMGGMREGA